MNKCIPKVTTPKTMQTADRTSLRLNVWNTQKRERASEAEMNTNNGIKVENPLKTLKSNNGM